MRIAQTFWTAGRDPLKESFGWLHPEYNLMSWSLSCLSLREHYDEVALYTDTRGKEVLIDLLHLPYTEVNVVFDDFPCLPQHWALAKIKTYSLQTKPFLHVDGDVYLPQPIAPAVLDAPLIAQNREIGTEYYRKMMDKVLEYRGITFPDYVAEGIHQTSVASYNMGVFGGSDIDFIHRYCCEALQFIESNHINNPKHANSPANCNILFEQVLLALLTDKEEKSVSCVIDRKIPDNGYTVAEFCDLNRYESQAYFHVLGGHKRKNSVVEMLSLRLIISSIKTFETLLMLFPSRHQRLFSNGDITVLLPTEAERIVEYYDFLTYTEQNWKNIRNSILLKLETDISYSINLLNKKANDVYLMTVRKHPFLKCFTIPSFWDELSQNLLKKYVACKDANLHIKHIGVIPSISNDVWFQQTLQDMDIEILDTLGKNELPITELVDIISSRKLENDLSGCYLHLINEIKCLARNKILIINLK